MNKFWTWLWAWINSFGAREKTFMEEVAEREADFLKVVLAVKDAVKLAKGSPVNLFELYDGLAAARRLYATREEFIVAVEHLIKG